MRPSLKVRPIFFGDLFNPVFDRGVSMFKRHVSFLQYGLHILERVQFLIYGKIKLTETVLVELIDRFQEKLTNKESVVYAFLNTEGTFDNIPHAAVRKQ